MATVTVSTVRARPAHPPGQTFLAYTPNGQRLVTAGSNSVVRIFNSNSDDEPFNIDDCSENNQAVAATNEYVITGAEDGDVSIHSIENGQYIKLLTRCTLPVRDISVSPDGEWAAVSSDDIEIKVVNIKDELKILYLRDHNKPAKHISWSPDGTQLSVSCTDGVLYIYEVNFEETSGRVLNRIDRIRAVDTTSEISSAARWHPNGRYLATPQVNREIHLITPEGKGMDAFGNGGHSGDITAFAFSPNGALLISAARDGQTLLWETKSKQVLARYEYRNVNALAWHPRQNAVSLTTSDGELFIHNNFVPGDHAEKLAPPVDGAEPLVNGVNGTKKLTNGLTNGHAKLVNGVRRRRPSVDSLDDILGPADDAHNDFVVDDDGAGYALNQNGKRPHEYDEDEDEDGVKKIIQTWEPEVHEPFQTGSTPWRGDRRYLTFNTIGYVWTVDQSTHNTITVEFYDRDQFRDFHFTDTHKYDKACLNEHGTVFSSPADTITNTPATIYYRPHEKWTSRADARITLPLDEDITALALSSTFITVTTSKNYIRSYTLFGTPYRLYRQKATPAVTCAAFHDYLFTIGNGPVVSSGQTSLLYTLENVRHGTIFQSDDTVALDAGASLVAAFFSDAGDPCIYDSTGVLLTLQSWRTPGQARWVPLLDTKLLERLATGRKDETYWPVAVADEKFHCIILKGGDTYPYFPAPLLTPLDFSVPLSDTVFRAAKRRTTDEVDVDDEGEGEFSRSNLELAKLEESFVRKSLLLSLVEDSIDVENASFDAKSTLRAASVEVDKAILQLLNVECREGEDKGMKALAIVKLLRDPSGSMLEAAGKIAQRYGRMLLAEKIMELEGVGL